MGLIKANTNSKWMGEISTSPYKFNLYALEIKENKGVFNVHYS